MMTGTREQWIRKVHQLGPDFENRATAHDRDDSFVAENYAELKENGFLAAAIPTELGGAGLSYSAMCEVLRTLAQSCSSTALALSMHQHLLAAAIWKYHRGQGGEEMLKRVAAHQPVLVSTGARDWLESNGEMVACEGGFYVTALKSFASQSALGDVLLTSAPYQDPAKGWQVLHFPVPMKAQGVRVLEDWQALGMRGTGSHTVKLERVFVPESSIALRRPRGEYHPFWNVVLTVAMPLIMSVYVGIAQKAARIALQWARDQKSPKPHLAGGIGRMLNELTSAELHLADMIRIANDLEFDPEDQHGQDILSRKTNVAHACIGVVTKAMETIGGQGFYRSFGLERLFRDVQAARYHPLPDKDQQQFLGEYMLMGKVKVG
jgi:alkylation response protein AidB-like acyl-CoA dehydrogenase